MEAKAIPSPDLWLREAKADAAAADCGMFLLHNGVVRRSAKARVRTGDADAPDVRGMRCIRAIDAIQNNSLNIGSLKFDSSVKNYSDSLNAVVLNQSPAASQMPMLMGSEVTLSLSIDPEKVAKVTGGN